MFRPCLFKCISELILRCSLNNFATLIGIASALVNGYTYSYVYKESRHGEKCCRPIKSKCRFDQKERGNFCKTTRGRIKCGKGCSRIIKALEKLERKEKKKKEQKNENKQHKKEKKQHKSHPEKNDTSALFHST